MEDKSSLRVAYYRAAEGEVNRLFLILLQEPKP